MNSKDKFTVVVLSCIAMVVLVGGIKVCIERYNEDKIANCAIELNNKFRAENPGLPYLPQSVIDENIESCRHAD